ncbi:MAG: diguanylate cyclase [Planctomycetaceae bacterium]
MSSTHRIVLGLVSLAVSVLLTAGLFGLIPNPNVPMQQSRQSFSESTAVSFMALAPRMDVEQLQATLELIRRRNPDVLSMGVRDAEGRLIVRSGPHEQLWPASNGTLTVNHNLVPITSNGKKWGQLELFWTDSGGFRLLGHSLRPDLVLTVFVAVSLFFAFSVFLNRVLKQISPGKVIPNRVRDALNALAEGLLVLDRHHTIVLANDSFATATGMSADELIGMSADSCGFRTATESGSSDLPWTTTAQSGRSQNGILLTRGDGAEQRTYSVSTIPVRDEKNVDRGVVASFEDVTAMQRKQEELHGALTSLKVSTEEVRKQNRELEWLATRDTLTGCLNRRSFFHEYERRWQAAITDNTPLTAVMVDIDHFKAVNDNHGHGMGDEVLRQVSAILMKTVSDTDLVCRYGGEEFSILMPDTSLDQAEMRAERCRLAIKALEFPNLRVTASLGVSALSQNPESPQDLLDQADKCLYVAKRHGRDQVVRYDRSQDLITKLTDTTAPARETERRQKAASAIPFQAVAALTSALAHRDQATAVHSRRVADMCVATAEGLLSLRECYVLEIAALLHDIGKIGIPDTILRKTGRLSPDEMELVMRYNRVGVDMVRGSFGTPVLTEIVEQHVVHFDMSNSERGAGPEHRPSIAARILSIANAYDTMTSELSHRDSMSRSEAFAELRRCAGTQFDPELVERFIAAVRLRSHEAVGCDIRASRDSALSIGLLLEHLVAALDDQNVMQLLDITASLQITAAKHGLLHIAKHAKQLHETLGDVYDEIEVMQMAGELLDLCRSTQCILLAAAHQLPEEMQTRPR